MSDGRQKYLFANLNIETDGCHLNYITLRQLMTNLHLRLVYYTDWCNMPTWYQLFQYGAVMKSEARASQF
ncbi:hypothetical protein V1477_007676 [Vespula maculifrons]|uniref:Uncharacterized protein n=2 Tax=Vespula TaxID=7451 RepID=A0A834K129_VESGE|nr:hypothetical protein HZH68_009301 [Vespula germanica]